MLKLFLLIHAGVTLMMAGAIWIVQIVHYPLFSYVGRESFAAYESAHMGAISCVVIPLMLTELATGFLLLSSRPEGVQQWHVIAGIVLILIVWGTTFFFNVPQHNALALSFDAETHRALVNSNWMRTLAWSLRGILVLWMVYDTMKI